MRQLLAIITLFLSCTFISFGQSVSDLIDQVSKEGILQIVREFSGEVPTTVEGDTVTIAHRVSYWSDGNDLAADYLKERLQSFGLDVTDDQYRLSGRNIYATQVGIANPDDIYIICGHYDAVNFYGADDNASGTAAVLEAARILSNYCFDNTLIYALWDEEESGLIGASNYATEAAANDDNILGVLNLDMCAYDGNNDSIFDIDVRNIADSYQIRDDLIDVVNDHNLALIPLIVDPGTSASDHSRFWSVGYSAVLLGESWETGDKTPGYHSANDRISLFNEDYFHNMVKLSTGYMATKGNLASYYIELNEEGTTLTSNITQNATYQWLDCNNELELIPGATSVSFTPEIDGNYAVEVSIGECSGVSNCETVVITGIHLLNQSEIKILPNPTSNLVQIDFGSQFNGNLELFSIDGQLLHSKSIQQQNVQLNLGKLSPAVYLIKVTNELGEIATFKVVKE